jgi:hypothetical protein
MRRAEGVGVGASDEAQHSGLRLMRGRRGAGKATLPQLRRAGVGCGTRN